jgi:Putative peptidoglycan binding domain
LSIGNRRFQFVSMFAVLLLLPGAASASTTTTTTKTKPKSGTTSASHSSSAKTKSSTASASHSSSKQHSKKHSTKTASHGQRGIDEQRTREIQAALIKEHYLSGEPTGVWDEASKDAMIRYQGDNGWQTKLTPDSRALIKLGLGPDHKGLLNPETANIPSQHELGTDNGAQPGGAADQQ